MSFVTPGTRGKLEVDQEAVAFGVPPASDEFLLAAIEAHERRDDRGSLARVLLDGYIPDGPATREDAESWKRWYNENVDYLFFSDSGGYRCYVDPLVKKREVPTDVLRGVRRASLPAFRFRRID